MKEENKIFKVLERKFTKGYDDFYNFYVINIDDYKKIKDRYLEK